MHRRELLQLALLAPLSSDQLAALGRRLHAAGSAASRPTGLTAQERAQVAAMADLILPATDTPGAIDVGVPAFIDHLVADWFEPDERRDLSAGLARIDQRGLSRFGRAFGNLTASERTAMLADLDGKSGDPGTAEHAYARIKSLTVYGYFTSEKVQKDVLKTVIIPGKFDGCIPVVHQ